MTWIGRDSIFQPFFCFTFFTSPLYRVKYPSVCLKGQISTLQRNRSMEGGVQFQSEKKKCRHFYISSLRMFLLSKFIIWAQPCYLPPVLSVTSLVVITLVTPGWWYSDLLFRSSSDSSSVLFWLLPGLACPDRTWMSSLPCKRTLRVLPLCLDASVGNVCWRHS